MHGSRGDGNTADGTVRGIIREKTTERDDMRRGIGIGDGQHSDEWRTPLRDGAGLV